MCTELSNREQNIRPSHLLVVNLIDRPAPWVGHVGDEERCPGLLLRWSEEPVSTGRGCADVGPSGSAGGVG